MDKTQLLKFSKNIQEYSSWNSITNLNFQENITKFIIYFNDNLNFDNNATRLLLESHILSSPKKLYLFIAQI